MCSQEKSVIAEGLQSILERRRIYKSRIPTLLMALAKGEVTLCVYNRRSVKDTFYDGEFKSRLNIDDYVLGERVSYEQSRDEYWFGTGRPKDDYCFVGDFSFMGKSKLSKQTKRIGSAEVVSTTSNKRAWKVDVELKDVKDFPMDHDYWVPWNLLKVELGDNYALSREGGIIIINPDKLKESLTLNNINVTAL